MTVIAACVRLLIAIPGPVSPSGVLRGRQTSSYDVRAVGTLISHEGHGGWRARAAIVAGEGVFPIFRQHLAGQMLDTLRRSASSWVIKILFVILILSFGIWGVGDYLTHRSAEEPAIAVGDITISMAAVQEEFSHDVNRLGAVMGNAFTAEEARRMGILYQTVNRLVLAAILDMAARAYGLAIPDELLLAAISRQKEFQDAEGRFDPVLFRHFVTASGQPEEAYFHHLRQQLLRAQVGGPVVAGVVVPVALIDRLYRHHYERRVAETVTVPIAAMPAPPPPDQAILEDFHKTHATAFTAPEYRTLSAILLTEPAVASLIAISEEMIRQAYDDSLSALRTPETRTVEQILFPERTQADAALERVRGGRSLAQTAAETAQWVTPLGRVTHADMESALADVVFAATVDTVVGPVPSAFGWHLFRVTAVEPERVPSLDAVRGRIREDLIAEKAGDIVYELSVKVEDALNGGVSLEDAAKQVGLTVATFAPMDRSGTGMDGKAIPDLPPMQAFLPTAFTVAAGTQNLMTESESGFFVVRVDAVVSSRLKSVGEIRQTLIDQWTAEQRREAARDQAEKVAERLKTGMSWHEAARNGIGAVDVSRPLLRTDADDHLPPAFVARLFDLAVGETAVNGTEEAFIVGRLREVIAPAADTAALANLKQEVTEQYARDVLTQFAAAIRREFDVVINPKVLEAR